MSIKDLANKVLERNCQRNRSETQSFATAKPEGEKVSYAKPEETAPESIQERPLPLPFFEADGNLVIPFGADPRYHWWAGGQLPSKTKKEIRTWKH